MVLFFLYKYEWRNQIVKIGVRKPSLKKSLKARTTGKLKRSLKKSVNPLYGKKGMGMINNPKKAVYNKVYSKTTVSAAKVVGIEPQKTKTSSKANTNVKTNNTSASQEYNKLNKKQKRTFWTNLFLIFLTILFIIFIFSML